MVLFGLGSMVRFDTTGAPAPPTLPVPVLEPPTPLELPVVVELALVMGVPPLVDDVCTVAVPITPPRPPLVIELVVAPPIPPAGPPVVVPADSLCVCEFSAPLSPAQPSTNTTTHAYHHSLVGPIRRP